MCVLRAGEEVVLAPLKCSEEGWAQQIFRWMGANGGSWEKVFLWGFKSVLLGSNFQSCRDITTGYIYVYDACNDIKLRVFITADLSNHLLGFICFPTYMLDDICLPHLNDSLCINWIFVWMSLSSSFDPHSRISIWMTLLLSLSINPRGMWVTCLRNTLH